MKRLSALLSASALLLLAGCAGVRLAPATESEQAKVLTAPSEGKAGLYVYRDDKFFGGALKKDIWLDGNCLGESSRGVFFYTEVAGNQPHTLSTESEFSPKSFKLDTEAGKNYFVRQYIKMGVFVGRADLESVSEEQGRAAIQTLKLAATGNCSQSSPQ